MSLFINNNSGPIYSGCTVTIQNGRTVVAPQEQPAPQAHSPRVAEEVTYEDVHAHFCYITEMCVKNNMVEHVESHLRIACTGSAETLWQCIHEFETMGYLGTRGIDAAKIYNALSDYFCPLKFTERNFRKYRL